MTKKAATRSWLPITIAMILVPALAIAQWATPSQDDVVIRGGWLFDGITDDRRRNSGIIIREGTFAAIDADLDNAVLSSTNVIDLSDTDTILPGMIDLHAHYNFDLVDNGRAEEVEFNGVIFLANGVTSTWSAGEYYPERVITQRDLIDAGEIVPGGLDYVETGHDKPFKVPGPRQEIQRQKAGGVCYQLYRTNLYSSD